MDIFKGQNLLEFSDRCKSDADCKEYLPDIKWKESYQYVKSNHTASQKRKDFPRICNVYSPPESATANTLFHKVKFDLRKVFFICFEMATSTKSLSASYMDTGYGVTEKTARQFMLKIREGMEFCGNHPMDGNIHVYKFVLGGLEQRKIGRSYKSKKRKP